MDGITSTCGDADDRLRLPQIPPPQSRGTEKKESQGRHHNQACRPSGKRSSTSSHDLHPDNVLTVTGSLQLSPSLKCQSSARCLLHCFGLGVLIQRTDFYVAYQT